jgi:DNA-binding MarR family transcriptional regulator
MKSKWDDDTKFLKAHHVEIEKALDLVAQRKLELRDMAVMWALMAYSSWRTGKIQVTAAKLAERLNMQEKHVIASLSRLRKELLLTRGTDPHDGTTFYLLNPYLVSAGPPQTKGRMWQVFKDSLA